MNEDNQVIHQGALFETILDFHNLWLAFKEVKKNKGAAGIDGITIIEFEKNLNENLDQLKKEVEGWRFRPTPVRRVEIEKSGGGIRLLGIPTIKDRVLHVAIKRVLEIILDVNFSPNSYGFRPGKNQRQAVEAAKTKVNEGKVFIVDIDLSKFFDRINHDRLISRLGRFIRDKRVLKLIGIILRSGIMDNGVFIPSMEGAVQGSPLSPLLSNLVLDELDKELEKRGLEFCRFADDCNIFVRTETAANRVMVSITKFIENKLKLRVNVEKSRVAKAELVKFLGMTIVSGCMAISLISMNKAMSKVTELTPRGTHLTKAQSITKINKWYRGWSNYYKMTEYQSQLRRIEAHLRRRLRARFVKQQKKKVNLYAKLVKMGVSPKIARGTVYKNRKCWHLSHTKGVELAFSNKWFETQGLYTATKEKLDHWKSSNELPRLS